MIRMKKGDTLIEVMFAVAVFASVMIGGIALMNAGVAKTQATLQLTMARNAMDAQAEILRYVNSVYVSNYPNSSDELSKTWKNIQKAAKNSASDLNECPNTSSKFDSSWFVIDPISMTLRSGSASLESASTYPRMVYSNVADTNKIDDRATLNFARAEGIWVEPVKGEGYYDFHIRACWYASGERVATTLGTIVRLYDPAK
ncbi:MAG: type II secretion system protein [bacterium]|nr:type II secretion system protein [bacterium]